MFGELYRGRFPIRRMQLVDDYGGDDERSTAPNNTSAHTQDDVAPEAGRRFLEVDRSAGADAPDFQHFVAG